VKNAGHNEGTMRNKILIQLSYDVAGVVLNTLLKHFKTDDFFPPNKHHKHDVAKEEVRHTD